MTTIDALKLRQSEADKLTNAQTAERAINRAEQLEKERDQARAELANAKKQLRASAEALDLLVKSGAVYPSASPRIFTRCPACANDTLTINKGHLICTWHKCSDPTLIDHNETLIEERDQFKQQLASVKQELTNYRLGFATANEYREELPHGNNVSRRGKVTKIEILELDAWIAAHVMGWKWYCAIGKAYLFPPWAFPQLDDFVVHWTAGLHEKGWLRASPEKKACKKTFEPTSIHGTDNKIGIPHYTTDPAAAMLVLERCCCVDSIHIMPPTADNNCEIWGGGARATADTLPLAVALFARQLFA